MEINRHNYELFAVDFIEGKMQPSDAAIFLAFLADNPDIAQEIELMRDFDTETVVPQAKLDFSFLKKDYNQLRVNEENFEELCIAFHEGDLSGQMQEKVIAYIKFNKEKQRIFDTYAKLKILPDQDVVYRNKKSLKHKPGVLLNARRMVLITTMAAAAGLAMVFILHKNDVPEEIKTIARTSVNTDRNGEDIKTPDTIRIAKVAEKQTKKIKNSTSGVKQIPIEKEDIIETNIAVVSDSADSDIIRLAVIEPKQIVLNNQDKTIALSIPRTAVVETEVQDNQTPIEEIRNKTNDLMARASHLSVDNIIKTGINGFNSIAETDLNYKSQTDKKGRIVEFALSSESFNIKRRIRNN